MGVTESLGRDDCVVTGGHSVLSVQQRSLGLEGKRGGAQLCSWHCGRLNKEYFKFKASNIVT